MRALDAAAADHQCDNNARTHRHPSWTERNAPEHGLKLYYIFLRACSHTFVVTALFPDNSITRHKFERACFGGRVRASACERSIRMTNVCVTASAKEWRQTQTRFGWPARACRIVCCIYGGVVMLRDATRDACVLC